MPIFAITVELINGGCNYMQYMIYLLLQHMSFSDGVLVHSHQTRDM